MQISAHIYTSDALLQKRASVPTGCEDTRARRDKRGRTATSGDG